MKPTDYDTFAQILSACTDMYNAKRPSETVLALWWNALKQYDIEAVQRAFSVHITNPDNGQFMPKPADIIRHIGGTNQDKALKAWSSLDYAVRHVGTYHDVVFDDPIIHAVVIDMGGWIKMGERSDSDWDFVRNEFVNRYRGYSSKQEQPKHVPVLTGISNAQNRVKGYWVKPPLLLGDKEKAKQVYLHGKPDAVRLPRSL